MGLIANSHAGGEPQYVVCEEVAVISEMYPYFPQK